MRTAFLETSALLRMLFGEESADRVRKALSRCERVFASRLIRVEAERAIIRYGLDRPGDPTELRRLERELASSWPHVDFLEISREICDLAGRLAPLSRLRTLDAIHLATFHRVREMDPKVLLLSFDQRLLDEFQAGPPLPKW